MEVLKEVKQKNDTVTEAKLPPKLEYLIVVLVQTLSGC